MTTYFLGIDAGSSSTKWALIDDQGNQVSRGKSAPVDGHLYREESKVRMNHFLSEIQKELKVSITGIYAGITGASDSSSDNQAIETLFQQHFPQSKVKVVMDVALGYRANVRDDHGVYIYAGTGSIAVYKDRSGAHRTVGGWGYLLGDEGAGYWIGITALRTILFEIEKGSHDSRLSEIFSSEDQPISFMRIKELVYGSPRNEVAALAKGVISLASDSDARALEIVKQAGSELSQLVKRTQALIGSPDGPIIFGGGIARASHELVEEMERILQRKIQVSSDDLSLDAARFALEDLAATN
ncbi:MAG: N-acetylglucosamine kinase [Actinomycetota bacterium]